MKPEVPPCICAGIGKYFVGSKCLAHKNYWQKREPRRRAKNLSSSNNIDLSDNAMANVFGGVEGGATHSTLILFDEKGSILAEVEGPGTNLFQIGLDETCNRIANLIKEALTKCGKDPNTKLYSLGLSLSGCEVEETNRELAQKFMTLYPNMVDKVPEVCSDTVGSLLTASDKGGVVLISGTGSNSLLVNPDGTIGRCGGWGHMLGDEGSAFWVTQKALKTWFDDEDNMVKPPFSTDAIRDGAKEYFGVEDRFGILQFCYDKFEKPHFAGFCKTVAMAAQNGDPMSKWILEEAGKVLAKHIVALAPKMSPEVKASLSVVCIGSVWKSSSFLVPGFVNELKANAPEIKGVTLLKLKAPMATGACYMAADNAIAKNYDQNTEVFFKQAL